MFAMFKTVIFPVAHTDSAGVSLFSDKNLQTFKWSHLIPKVVLCRFWVLNYSPKYGNCFTFNSMDNTRDSGTAFTTLYFLL